MTDHQRKKRYGIYYTPDYIIDFIIKYTLELFFRENKVKPDSIKALDPSCGSGLFLQKIFYYLRQYYNKFDYDSDCIDRTILLNNIYGVDIDKAAIETAKFDLLLQSDSKISKATDLSNNIKAGNSIIDDKSIDKNYFNWFVEYPEIMNKGGFDIIVGNPPWVSIKGKQKTPGYSSQVLDYLIQKYPCDKYRPNLFEIFIWRSMELLKESGYFSFIVPDRLGHNIQFQYLREKISNNYLIKYLWYNPKFKNVISDNLVFIIKKEKPKNNSQISIAEYPHYNFQKISQNEFLKPPEFRWAYINKNLQKIFDKINQNPEVFELSHKFRSGVGFIGINSKITDKKINEDDLKIVKGENISRYFINNFFYYKFVKENILGGTQRMDKLTIQNKVLLRKTGENLIAAFDGTGIIPEQSLYFIYTGNNNKDDLLILTALLNSKLLNCYYRNLGITNKNTTPQLKKADLDKFPILIPNKAEIIPLIQSVSNSKDKSILKNKMHEIDNIVFSAYGLTKEEVHIIKSQ